MNGTEVRCPLRSLRCTTRLPFSGQWRAPQEGHGRDRYSGSSGRQGLGLPCQDSRVVGRVDRTVFGVDSVQALSIALMHSGTVLTSSREFLAGRLHVWDKPAKTVFEIVLPLPLHSVQSALEQLSWVVQRMKAGTNVNKEWRAGVLTVLRNVEKELQLRSRSVRMSATPRLPSGKRSRGSSAATGHRRERNGKKTRHRRA